MTAPLITFENVTKGFGQRTILDAVNLEIHEGDISTIIGKSGSGKSVLLKHIIGLLKPDEGEIFFRGVPLSSFRKHEWDDYLGRISYMFQNNALFDSLTVFENVALPLQHTTKLAKNEIFAKVMDRIEQTELAEVADRYPSELSGGMQKRAALARALVTDPQIVLFDEPTTGQDPIRKNAILSMVAEYQQRFRFSAVLISHDIPDVFYISNRILALYDGKIVFQGTPEGLESFDHPFNTEFLASIEGFQERLTGLYSRRHFKMHYQNTLRKKEQDDEYVVAVFSLEDLPRIRKNLGHEVTQEALKFLGAYINRHFGGVGGFSTRQSADRFVTVLPHSSMEEAEEILNDFQQVLDNRGVFGIHADSRGTACVGGIPFELTIAAGIAAGTFDQEIETVVGRARASQKTISRIPCKYCGGDA